jgi:hypothetical protein
MEKMPIWEAEIKADNRIVEDWLLWINERKQAVLSIRLEIIESSGPGLIYLGMGCKNIVSDPTGRKGMKLADHRIQKNEEWIKLIEDVENRLDEKMRLFLELRREHRNAAGRNGWTAAIQWKYAQEAAKRFSKHPEETWVESRNTFTAWWNKIVNYTARQAAKRGLFNG